MAPHALGDFATTSIPKRPSEQTIAFAVSIVLSKPEDLSVREHIRLLRQHVAKGRGENAISAVHRHLDRSSYWRSEYERTKDALRAAEGEAVDLRVKVNELTAKLEDAARALPKVPAKKRKKPVDEDVVMVPRSPKRARRAASPSGGEGGAVVNVERDFDFEALGEVGKILMRNLYQIQTATKSRPRVEPALLAYHLIRAASALPQVVKKAVEQSFQRPFTAADLLKTTLTPAGRGIALLMVSINRLDQVAEGDEVRGQLVYAYIQMYSHLLDILDTVSEAELRKAATADTVPSLGTKLAPSRAKTKIQQAKLGNLKDNPTLSMISSFLCGIVGLLDAKLDLHNALFEGFAYITLNRIGARLYTSVFGHDRGTTLEVEINISNRPDNIADSTSTPPMEEPDVRKAKLEAPYYINLLTRIMSAAPSHLGGLDNTRSRKVMTKPPKPNAKGSTKGALAIHAKDRLQRTLVKCMFGTEVMAEDDEFFDCLRMPSLVSGQGLSMPKVKETQVQEWFKEEVWRLVGWEVLGKEGDW